MCLRKEESCGYITIKIAKKIFTFNKGYDKIYLIL